MLTVTYKLRQKKENGGLDMLPSATRRKASPEVQELERLYNAETIRRNRDVDARFLQARHFKDHSDGELIFCVMAYLSLLGGESRKSATFTGVESTLHGYRLIINVDVSKSGRADVVETREKIEVTVNSFAQFKHLIDEL